MHHAPRSTACLANNFWTYGHGQTGRRQLRQFLSHRESVTTGLERHHSGAKDCDAAFAANQQVRQNAG
jgi:hypothetical protein